MAEARRATDTDPPATRRPTPTVDVGGIPVDEAPGFEMLIRGMQARHPDDDALLAAAVPAFDAYYTAFAGAA